MRTLPSPKEKIEVVVSENVIFGLFGTKPAEPDLSPQPKNGHKITWRAQAIRPKAVPNLSKYDAESLDKNRMMRVVGSVEHCCPEINKLIAAANRQGIFVDVINTEEAMRDDIILPGGSYENRCQSLCIDFLRKEDMDGSRRQK